MRLLELLDSAGYALPGDVENVEVTGVTSNSKAVLAGNVFVAVCGMHRNGADFAKEAVANGAVLIVSENDLKGLPCLVAKNARKALAELLNAWHGNPCDALSLIGVTGTNGKTSTATMLYAILRRAGYRCGLIGTVSRVLNDLPLAVSGEAEDANMTTPDPEVLYALLAQMRSGGARYVVMEVSSHALALSKVTPLRFARAVFTNLTPEHLDLHGDMEQYFAEKKKLFSLCQGAVISCLTPYGQRLFEEVTVPCWRLGAQEFAGVRLLGTDGVCFSLCEENGRKMAFSLPVAGDFSAENGAFAALTALSLGVPPCTVRQALQDFGGVRGRLERVSAPTDDLTVFLDYAHTPDALERVLRTVRAFRKAGQRILLLFGCGGDRDRSKRAEMGRIASQLADLVVLTSDNCRTEDPQKILDEILRGLDKEKPYHVLCDRQEAIAYAVSVAQSGDILLLAGKGHEEYEIKGTHRLPFSEREIVRECLAKRRCGTDADPVV